MNDRMTVAAATRWSHIPPTDGRTVEIYFGWNIIPAFWDGQVWRDPETKDVIAEVAWWKEPETKAVQA